MFPTLPLTETNKLYLQLLHKIENYRKEIFLAQEAFLISTIFNKKYDEEYPLKIIEEIDKLTQNVCTCVSIDFFKEAYKKYAKEGDKYE